ncbi:hypothetical protein PN480_14540 [Dolichospermum circinale CS-1225]|uniref:Uncharacterized protein n=2 Tax=Dolichospermum TaxID=748770 RepID=A0ABT5AI21_9CYAN|nr:MULTISPECIES: hypothetical protein [Dolichospermum]MDB9458354.1 hypothetical protein [Dolichospermum circinale CS-545/17]MDB9468184.1 hypothetical protein [Dolichospermum circinale CS-539/09]MDB9470180.1 hypothetical protein [Dolichospermum circinale CS-539]MDB9487996.1 hypothetical protein [Dolichospermum circinale CS-537/01]MDB9523153.1 hypothetical protein [Dolichospermum circinale CS-1225]
MNSFERITIEGYRRLFGDSFNLEHWLEEYSLDQVWAMNLMGGRP